MEECRKPFTIPWIEMVEVSIEPQRESARFLTNPRVRWLSEMAMFAYADPRATRRVPMMTAGEDHPRRPHRGQTRSMMLAKWVLGFVLR